MRKTNDPRSLAGDAGAGDDHARPRVEPDFRAFFATRKAKFFWLHVTRDGREQRWTSEPGRHHPTFTIEEVQDQVGRWWQITRTRDFQNGIGPLPVRPRGEGWEEHDASADSHTVWRRPLCERQS